LRRVIIFGRHDLVQDAPISRVDLIACRNTLMYFNSDAQARILARFFYALKEGGYLFLGKAETLLAHSKAFAPVELKFRIFTRPRGRAESPSPIFRPIDDGNANGCEMERAPMRALAFQADAIA